MWIGDTIFFNSDRDGHFNLYAYTPSNGKTVQVTTNRQWDVRWPSSDNEGRIVYELNGELQVMDARSRKSRGRRLSGSPRTGSGAGRATAREAATRCGRWIRLSWKATPSSRT